LTSITKDIYKITGVKCFALSTTSSPQSSLSYDL